MSLQLRDIRRIVTTFLSVFNEIDIKSLTEDQPKKFPVAGRPNDFISVEYRISSSLKKAYTRSPTISYNIFDGGVPLEVRINRYEDYTHIIVKTAAGLFPGYKLFAIDPYSNIVQYKKIPTTKKSRIRQRLKELLVQENFIPVS